MTVNFALRFGETHDPECDCRERMDRLLFVSEDVRHLVARIGRLASGAGRCRTTAPFLTLGSLPCRSKPRRPVAVTFQSSSTGSSTGLHMTLAYVPAAA